MVLHDLNNMLHNIIIIIVHNIIAGSYVDPENSVFV